MYYFRTAQTTFGGYQADSEPEAKRMWAEELNCNVNQLPDCEVFEL